MGIRRMVTLDRKRVPSGMLGPSFFLTWAVVAQVCSLCNHSLGCTYELCIFFVFCFFFIFIYLFSFSFKKKPICIQDLWELSLMRGISYNMIDPPVSGGKWRAPPGSSLLAVYSCASGGSRIEAWGGSGRAERSRGHPHSYNSYSFSSYCAPGTGSGAGIQARVSPERSLKVM